MRASALTPPAYARTSAGGGRWQVSFYVPPSGTPAAARRSRRSIVDDRSGRVLEAWTGPQVAWTMARGIPGQFGRAVNAPWVWIGLCVLFVAPFLRPPLRLLHLDLAVLLAFSVSYAFFGAGEPRRLGALGVSAARLPARAHAVARVRAPRGASRADARRSGSPCRRGSLLLGARLPRSASASC